jgi:hypothetical protein
MKHRNSTSLFAVVAFAVSLTVAAPARAATIQLGFLLDSSGSIGAGNWGVITAGLANAITAHIPIGGPDVYEISVVTFSSGTQTVLNHQLINSLAAKTAAAAAVAAAPFLDDNTNYEAGFEAIELALTSSPNFSAGGLSYVNFATDGAPNEPGGTGPATLAGIAARDALIAAGIDNISIEGIGIAAAGAMLLQNSFCYPQACDTTSPFNFPGQGFYLGVADAQGYADAIGTKIQTVTTPVPEPTSLLLLGGGLLFAGSRLRPTSPNSGKHVVMNARYRRAQRVYRVREIRRP